MWFFSSCGGILELQREIQASSSVGPGKSSLPFELRGRVGDCSRVTAGKKRPHLGLCPGPNVSLQGRQGSPVRISDSPEESGLASRGKEKTPLSSRVATGMSWSPLSDQKGVKPPVEFGKRIRDSSPGHAGKEGLHLAMTEASRVFSGAGDPVWDFSRGMTWSSGSLSCGAREVKSPCEWRGERVIALESW